MSDKTARNDIQITQDTPKGQSSPVTVVINLGPNGQPVVTANGVHPVEEAKHKASEHILNSLAKVKTKEDVSYFMKLLSESWPEHHPSYDKLTSDAADAADKPLRPDEICCLHGKVKKGKDHTASVYLTFIALLLHHIYISRMEFTAIHKEEVERTIVQSIISALEKSEIKEKDLPDIAEFVLEKIDKIQNQGQLVEHLVELNNKWPVFKNLVDIEVGRAKTDLEQKTANDVLRLAHSGNIEEAIRLAKQVTEQ